TGQAALKAVKEIDPDVIVLDIMLPDIDGLEVLRRVRETHPRVPVLFLTAKDSVAERIAGLTAGGDDYVTKPFSLEEVVARIRAILRRTRRAEDDTRSSTLTLADLELDEDSYEVRRAGREIELSPTEFKLLRYLMLNSGRVLSKAQILDHVWQYAWGGDANIVESYISYLRRKIDAAPDASSPAPTPLIHTKRGVGYVLRLPSTVP
ncbi:MAG TPA: response regulator transcription factor, partial [Cellulomonadaceae bacterium]|nr:response regulator transcription factor [Cellulomonadaceae bacterium]